jgi:hypothetical protein
MAPWPRPQLANPTPPSTQSLEVDKFNLRHTVSTVHAHHDPNTSITKLQSQGTIAEDMHQCTLEAYTQRNLVRFARIVPEYHIGIIQVSSRLSCGYHTDEA